MFFRLKATGSGQVVKLLESYRDVDGKSRHRTVASLGNAPINWDERKAIAKAVEGRLYGQGELVAGELSEQGGQWVDRILRQVSVEGSWRLFPRPYCDPVRTSMPIRSLASQCYQTPGICLKYQHRYVHTGSILY